ncbi:MAG: winged helix-turn-helix domain-containing protein [Actinomycetota bacterium]|nr:winged helix-turn-helix domain-containing protein [Actinomycetota bacterium]
MSSGANTGGHPEPGAASPGFRQPVPYRAVFEFLPSGVLVTNATSHLTGANLTARNLLGAFLAGDDLTCCELLGCRRPGTPLADHCITQLALERPEPLPEVRVDVAREGAAPASFWVSATSIGNADAAVIVQLRPGVVGDRRRRTEPHWTAGPRLRVFTLGRTRLESSEAALSGEWLSHRPGEVLKYLVCERTRVVPIDELLEVLWPQGRAAATNVRQAVHTLRDRLEPQRAKHGQSPFVAARKGGYELERANLWIDADDFEASARAGLSAAQSADLEMAEPALARAAALYRGDFLADDPYAEWAFAERDRLRDLAAQVLRAFADLRIDAGDLETACEHLQRLAELEPFDLDAQRDLLALLMRRGRHADAHRRYEVVRRRYKRAFGEEPDLVLAELSGEPRPS